MKLSEKCCGCGACYNICPVNAISMELDDGGFIVPNINEAKCIKCNKCQSVCPSNHNHSTEQEKILDIKALWNKSEETLKNSFSGGVFFELAKNIVNNGGYVYGAVYDNKKVIHKLTNNIDIVKQMRGSKYVQSQFYHNFRELEKLLRDGNSVLISGTPCQILGIKNYLSMKKIDLSNAIFLDLICHGVPSEQIYIDYLKEVEKINNDEISIINFRDKPIIDNKFQMVIKSKEKELIKEPCIENTYGKAFLKNLIIRDSCNECVYKCINGDSDITLGDFWGAHIINEAYQNDDGISIMFIHSQKGLDELKKIEKNFQVFNDIKFKDVFRFNYPICNPSIAHPCKKDFFEEYKKKNTSIIELIEKNMELEKMQYKGEKSVGILNFHYEDHNYGANLVAYSLQQALKKIGYKGYNINFNPYDELTPFEEYGIEEFRIFRQNHLNVTVPIKNNEELKYTNVLFDKFIVGSDQVWRKDITQTNLLTYFLNFVNDYKVKIAYAASFGVSKWQGTKEETKTAKELLQKFQAISVREKNAVEICKEQFEIVPDLVIDPTLLLDKQEYEEIIEERDKITVDYEYAAYYFLFDNDGTIEKSEKMKQLLDDAKLKLINIRGKETELCGDKVFKYNSIGKWIYYIKNCKMLITDSYHGVIFAIIYNKPFIYINNNKEAISRINNLTKFIDIEKYMYSNIQNVEHLSISKIDYDKTNYLIASEREKAFNFLKESLDKEISVQECKKILEKENANLNRKLMEALKKEEDLMILKDKNNFNEKELQKNVTEMNKLYENIRILVDKNNFSEKELQKNVAEMNKLYENIKVLIDENVNLKSELKELYSNNEKLKNQLQDILNSRSWKITKPFRKISNKMKNK